MNPIIENMAIKKAACQLALSNAYKGIAVLPHTKCEFRYQWDFSKSNGLAYLVAINGTPVNIVLYPLGPDGMWDFVSAMQPTRFIIHGKTVVIYRVALNIDPFTGEESAAILFDPFGSSIVSTVNFDIYCPSLTA